MTDAKRIRVRELARAAKIPPSTAHRFLAGYDIHLSTAAKIAPHLEHCPCCGERQEGMTDAQQLHLIRQRLLDVDSALMAGQEHMAMAMLQELIEEAKTAVGEKR